MGGPNLDNYVEVNERIAAFHDKYPDGSLQGEWEVRDLGENTVIVYTARAYRKEHDSRPGVGTATEPVPGRTPYTKDSELMNAETSAWGRALAALGFEVKRGIASKEEVQSAQQRQSKPTVKAGKGHKGFAPGGKQRPFFERLLKQAGASQDTADLICAWASVEYEGVSNSITTLKEGSKDEAKKHARELAARAQEWQVKQSDVPADLSGLPA
jgi:hypothetical protein